MNLGEWSVDKSGWRDLVHTANGITAFWALQYFALEDCCLQTLMAVFGINASLREGTLVGNSDRKNRPRIRDCDAIKKVDLFFLITRGV